MMDFHINEVIAVKTLIRHRCWSLFKRIADSGGGWQPISKFADRCSLFLVGMPNALRPQNWVLGFSKARLCPAG